jgi:predicted ester cyclase
LPDDNAGVTMTAKAVFKLYTEALDRGDLDAMTALIHDDFRLEGAGLDGIGKPEFMAAMKAQLDAFPDYSENPTDITEDGDVVHFVAHVRGTQQGTLALPGMTAIPPTGRQIELPPEPGWVKVRDGQMLVYHVEAVEGGGIRGILSQLGVGSVD